MDHRIVAPALTESLSQTWPRGSGDLALGLSALPPSAYLTACWILEAGEVWRRCLSSSSPSPGVSDLTESEAGVLLGI